MTLSLIVIKPTSKPYLVNRLGLQKLQEELAENGLKALLNPALSLLFLTSHAHMSPNMNEPMRWEWVGVTASTRSVRL